MSKAPSSRVTVFATGALVLSAALAIAAAMPRLTRRAGRADPARLQTEASISEGRVRSGTELIALFIASSTCGASNHPTLPADLRRIRAALASNAAAGRKRFAFVGVALDENPRVGIQFLERFGPFDEILSGGSWVGTGAIDFMIRGIPGPLALPQLLVLERTVKVDASSINVSADRIVARVLGFDEMALFLHEADSSSHE